MPKIEYEGKVKEVRIIEKMTGEVESKEAQVTITTDNEEEIVIKKLDWVDAKGYTPKDSVKITVSVTQTKLTNQ